MTAQPAISVIIVSQGRDDLLTSVLRALRLQRFKNFEVIVVTRSQPAGFVPPEIDPDHIKYVNFTQENISAARNQGLAIAAGEIAAFIDDDAIPDPDWLARLIPAFDNPQVGAAGGFVRGRNGISYQWRGIEFDVCGRDYDLEITAPMTRGIENGRVLKVQGTNCAFRLSAILPLGGFDEGFRYYLDETDLSLRVAQAGWLTSIIPDAQVHHGFAASTRRSAARIPQSLELLGRSMQRFLQKHAPEQIDAQCAQFSKDQHRRLSGLLVWGHLDVMDMGYLMDTLKAGLSDSAVFSPVGAIEQASDFLQYPTSEMGDVVLHASIWRRGSLMKRAKESADRGNIVNAFCLSYTTLFHKRIFHKDGYWMQTGGVFGKSNRSGSLLFLKGFTIKSRVIAEVKRLGIDARFY
ncbi:hypothetical protein GCM10007939_17900 [Amylibacter marinus]|uniref:Glycosyltransferase 2-like domain-containing protein n=1 Tax=Amylibacter marinus TaxID=1475483 RepID=A0ABQ5VWF0_9RHOB|nr:glycosyltransferase [Amylibacter marinus]GLQ35507.1 hypothetical protein GCM10007939_17900 [Amylibacter marinus]